MAIPLERLEGKYEMLEKLREGGMGAIYKVRHRLQDELRVIKTIRSRHADDPSVHARFLEEAKVATRLDHPGLAKVHDFVADDDGSSYLVMEFIPGVTLGELLRIGRRLPVALVLEIARQALETIAYLHRLGIVHRDVSPDNLMLTQVDGEPRVQLIDFGLVKSLDGRACRLTAAGMFVGKFRYAAPEQFDDDDGDARPADMYALAVVLYELLTGKYPIAGSGPTSLIAGHLFRPPLAFEVSDPEGQVPEEVRRAVLQGLEKAAGDRFKDAESFADALAGSSEFDPSDPEVAAILEATRGDALPRLAPVPRPGSTQVRLDLKFLAEPTPAPEVTRPLAVASEPVASETEASGEVPGDEIAALLRRAREEHGAGRLDDAIALADRARRLAPQHALIRVLIFDLEQELEERQANKARQATRRGAEEKIRRLVASGDFESAARRLPEALEVAGPTLVLQNLQGQVERQLGGGDEPGGSPGGGEEVHETFAAARRKARSEDFEAAGMLLDRVLDKMPGDPEALALRASVEVCLEARAAESRQAEDVERTLVGIQTLLDSGKTSAALEELGSAGDRFGDYGAFETLRQEAVRTRVLELQDQEDLRTLILPVMSRPREKSSVKENPSPSELSEAGAPESHEAPGEKPVAEVTAAIRRYQSEGRPGRALEELQRAIRTHGQTAAFRTLRSELGQQMLDRDAEEDRSAELVMATPPPETPPDLRAPGSRPTAGGPMDLPLAGDPLAGRTPGSAQAGLGGAAPSGGGFAMAPRHAGSGMGRWKWVLGFLVVVASVLAGVGIGRFGDFETAESAEAAPREDLQPILAQEPGFLALDARPWAEIVTIRPIGESPSEATETPDEVVEITPSRFTPVVLRLPAGSYRILLRHPPSAREEEIEVRIESGVSVEYRWTSGEIDGTKYFETVGW